MVILNTVFSHHQIVQSNWKALQSLFFCSDKYATITYHHIVEDEEQMQK